MKMVVNILFIYIYLDKKTAFTSIDSQLRTEKAVVFTDSLKPLVMIQNKKVDVPEVSSKKEIESLLRRIHHLRACVGHTDEDCRKRQWSEGCYGYLPHSAGEKVIRCPKCAIVRKSLKKAEEKQSVQEKLKSMRAKIKHHTLKASRLTRKVENTFKV